MAINLFISEHYIKENTIIDENVDVKLLQQVIVDAQRIHIEPYLGTALYNKISTEIGTGTFTASNQTLLEDYIQPALRFWVLVEGVDTLTYKWTNKAIVKKKSEVSDPAPLDELLRLIEKYKNKAEFYTQRLIKYLIENSTTFPEYENPGTGVDTVFPRKTAFRSGIYMGNSFTYRGDIDYGRENYQ